MMIVVVSEWLRVGPLKDLHSKSLCVLYCAKSIDLVIVLILVVVDTNIIRWQKPKITVRKIVNPSTRTQPLSLDKIQK